MSSFNKTFAAAAMIGLGTFLFAGCSQEAKVTYVTEQVKIGDIRTEVTATGTIEPVTEVTVGTQVSGIVSKLYVDYNSVVKKGQVIAELDKTNLLSELQNAKNNLNSAKSDMDYQAVNYKRMKELHDKGLISDNDFDNAKLSYQKSKDTYSTQQQNVAKAETNLGYATITSPIDGIVLSKSVEEGQTVAASFSTPTLFTIAQDLTDMRVIANIDEADIGGIVEGQRVTFTVDAFPDDTFEGKVTQVRQEATTESNVVTYEVVISAPNEDLKLKPGLTASVSIITSEATGALCVSNKALRFTPSEAVLGEGEQIIDCDAANKVWVRDGKNIKAIAVTTGVTNGTQTEITSGVEKGQAVIVEMSETAVAENSDEDSSNEESNPFMPSPPGSKNNKK